MQTCIFGPFLVRATGHQLTGLPEYLQQQKKKKKRKILKQKDWSRPKKENTLDLNLLWVRDQHINLCSTGSATAFPLCRTSTIHIEPI